MKYDVIIIGSGITGLFNAAYLSEQGLKVLILEQSNTPGGLSQSLHKNGTRFDIGHQLLGGIDEFNYLDIALNDLKINKSIRLRQLQSFHRVISPCDNIDFELKGEKRDDLSRLLELFPEDSFSLKKFYKIISRIRKENFLLQQEKDMHNPFQKEFSRKFPTLSEFSNIDTYSYFKENFKNHHLVQVLTANTGKNHLRIKNLSFINFAITQSSLLENGISYIEGGGHSLVKSLLKKIRNNGGRIFLNCELLNVNVGTFNIKSIKVSHRNSIKRLQARFYVSNISPVTFFSLPFARDYKIVNRINNLKYNDSAFINFAEACPKESKSITSNYQTTIIDDELNIGITNYSHAEAFLKKSPFTIKTFADLSNWHSMYSNSKFNKDFFSATLHDVVCDIFPKAKNMNIIDSYTPQTFQRRQMSPNGCIHGFDLILNQATFRRFQQESVLNNLLFASAWSNQGPGLEFAALGGKQAAQKIIKFLNSSSNKKDSPSILVV